MAKDKENDGYEFEIYGKSADKPIRTIRIPRSAQQCQKVSISLTSLMVITAIVPFIIVTCMHIAYALTCTSQYTTPVAVGMILLNVLCILPYISWIAFVGLFVWLVLCFIRRSQHPECVAQMQVQRNSVFRRSGGRSAAAETTSVQAGGGDAAAAGGGTGSLGSLGSPVSAPPTRLDSISNLSSLLDDSSNLDLASEASTALQEDAGTTSSFDSAFSESSLNDFAPKWRSPI